MPRAVAKISEKKIVDGVNGRMTSLVTLLCPRVPSVTTWALSHKVPPLAKR